MLNVLAEGGLWDASLRPRRQELESSRSRWQSSLACSPSTAMVPRPPPSGPTA